MRVASAIHALDLDYVVITSVDRDDLPDGGASIFADTIQETRARLPRCRLEVLIPDFQGNEEALRTVLDARPDILNHNTETVPRLYRMARSGGRYSRTLELPGSLAPLRTGHSDDCAWGLMVSRRGSSGGNRRHASRIFAASGARF